MKNLNSCNFPMEFLSGTSLDNNTNLANHLQCWHQVLKLVHGKKWYLARVYFLKLLKTFMAPIEELGKFTNSVTVIACLLFLVAQNNFPLLVSCKTISLTRPTLPVTKCRGVGGVVISPNQTLESPVLGSPHVSPPTTVFPLQKMGRKMTLAKVAQHVNDFGMKPVRGKFKEGDVHSSGMTLAGKWFNSFQLLCKDELPTWMLHVTTFQSWASNPFLPATKRTNKRTPKLKNHANCKTL